MKPWLQLRCQGFYHFVKPCSISDIHIRRHIRGRRMNRHRNGHGHIRIRIRGRAEALRGLRRALRVSRL